MKFNNVSTEVTMNGIGVKIHAFSTGAVSVKTKFRESVKKGWAAKLDILFDSTFTEWLPIWVWVIEHPEGVFVIDTGVSHQVEEPGYFRALGLVTDWLNRKLFRFSISREQEIDEQLRSIHIEPEDVKTVVLTHLHLDHVDGLKHFPKANILVNQLEWKKPTGDLHQLYPDWFHPELLRLNSQYQDFDRVCYLTAAKDFMAIHTPGHTNGHMSLLLKTDDGYIMFAGDLVYTQDQLIRNTWAAANVSHKKTMKTYRQIRTFSQSNKLVFLPSHDKEAGERIKALSLLDS